MIVRKEVNPMNNLVSFEAQEIAHIIARNQDNPQFLRALLTQAIVYERLTAKA